MSVPRGAAKRGRRAAFGNGIRNGLSDEEEESNRAINGERKPKRRVPIEESDEEDDMETQNSMPSTPRAESTKALELENGTIESIELKNFMCHTFLELRFSPTVNFVIGRNGSGKSAVMSAIMVALGGSATSTSRGQSLKSFVKKGETTAIVTVRLRNSSIDPFKGDVYGKSIVVERKIHSDQRPGTYKIRNHSGNVVSCKKEELLHALDHFNVVVDNPVCLLTQDTSRNYLHSSSAKDKYNLFIKATQLEQIRVDYDIILENQEIMEETLKRKKTTMPMLEQSVVQLEDKVKDLDELDELIKRKEAMSYEMAWAIVIDQERIVWKQRKVVENQRAKELKFIEKVEEAKILAEEAESAHKSVEDKFAEMTKDLEELHDKQKTMKDDARKKKEAVHKVHRELKRLTDELKSATEDKETVESRIREMETATHRDRKAEKQRKEDRKQELNQQIKECVDQNRSCQEEKRHLEERLAETSQKLYQSRSEMDEKRRAIDNCESQLRTLQKNKADTLQIYGSWAAAVLQDIERERGFRKKPKGPIGRYLNVRGRQWAPAVEEALGNLICAFCCEGKDYELLQRIIDRHCRDRKPPIVRQQFLERRHDVRPNLPQSSEKNFFDVVECQDPVVFNVIVDQKNVDSVLFIENADVAKRVMHIEKPRRARVAYTVNRDQVYGGATNRFYSGNGKPARVLQQSVEGRIREETARLASLNHELSDLQHLKESVDRQKRELDREKGNVTGRHHRLENQLSGCRGELAELDLVEDDDGPSDLAALKEAQEESQMTICALTQESELKKTEKSDRRLESDTQIAMVEEISGQISDALTQMDEKRNELAGLHSNLTQTQKRLTQNQSRQEEVNNLIAKEETLLENKEKELEVQAEKATRICPRVDTEKTSEELDRDLTRMEQLIQNKERTNGNREDIIRKCDEARNVLKSTEKNIKSYERCLKKLDEVMKKRQKTLKEYRSSLSLRAQTMFKLAASHRGYEGKMTFDHKKKELRLKVHTTQENQMGTSDMKALSGGERSFTTVCYVLSLWIVIDSPIRMLDEFDIFMDMVNRRVSMGMLVQSAKEHASKQHVFLSPQDMSAFTGGSDVRTLRLRDPDRNQGHLNFPRAV